MMYAVGSKNKKSSLLPMLNHLPKFFFGKDQSFSFLYVVLGFGKDVMFPF